MMAGWLKASTHWPREGRYGSSRDSSRQGSDRPARQPDRPQAELAGDVDEGDHVVGGDVVGPGRSGADDAQAQRLGHVVLVDDLQGQVRHEGGQAGQAPQRCAHACTTGASTAGTLALAPTASGPSTIGGRSR